MNDSNSVIVRHNYWRVPSPERAFDGWLEGCPSAEELLQVIAKAEADRAAWKPRPEGMELVETLKAFVGYRVQIQFWDSCMYLLEQEGPYPLNAMIEGVILLTDDGFVQAYLELSDAVEQPNLDGYSPMGFLQKRGGSVFDMAALANIYSVTKI
jgi:hypothetical protein